MSLTLLVCYRFPSSDLLAVNHSTIVPETGPAAEPLAPRQEMLLEYIESIGGEPDLRQMRALGLPTRVLILTSFADEAEVREAGAIGYLMKDVLKEELLAAIEAATEGRPTLHPLAQSR